MIRRLLLLPVLSALSAELSVKMWDAKTSYKAGDVVLTRIEPKRLVVCMEYPGFCNFPPGTPVGNTAWASYNDTV